MKILYSMVSRIDNFLGLRLIREDIEKVKQRQEEIEKRMTIIEERLVETSRALAMLAIGHGGLVREFGRLVELEEKRQTKRSVLRKSNDDFTN